MILFIITGNSDRSTQKQGHVTRIEHRAGEEIENANRYSD